MELDSLLIDSNFLFNGTVAINKPSKAYKLCRDYKTIKIYYTSEEKTVFRMLVDDSIFHIDTLLEASDITLKKMNFSKAPKSMDIQFSSNTSPIIFGISLEGKKAL